MLTVANLKCRIFFPLPSLQCDAAVAVVTEIKSIIILGFDFMLNNPLGMYYCSRDYMDRLVDEAEALGGAVHSSALTSNSRTETIPDQQLSILNSITANDLTGKSRPKKKILYLVIS